MVNLVAVQPEVSLENYKTASSFRQKIMGLCEQAVSGLPKHPTLVAFPELIGFPLLLLCKPQIPSYFQALRKY